MVAVEPVQAKDESEQCKYKTEKGRQCKLKVNAEGKHPGQHRMVFRNTEKPVLPAGLAIKMETIPADANVSKQSGRTTAPRDADQKKYDADAMRTYEKWVKGGRVMKIDPEVFKKFGSRYVVPASVVDAVLYYLRNTVNVGSPLAGKRFLYRRGVHESGKITINFLILDPAPKK